MVITAQEKWQEKKRETLRHFTRSVGQRNDPPSAAIAPTPSKRTTPMLNIHKEDLCESGGYKHNKSCTSNWCKSCCLRSNRPCNTSKHNKSKKYSSTTIAAEPVVGVAVATGVLAQVSGTTTLPLSHIIIATVSSVKNTTPLV